MGQTPPANLSGSDETREANEGKGKEVAEREEGGVATGGESDPTVSRNPPPPPRPGTGCQRSDCQLSFCTHTQTLPGVNMWGDRRGAKGPRAL